MGSVVNFADKLKEIVEAGEVIEGNVVRIVADNGDDVGDAVQKVVTGGNGVGASVFATIKATTQGAVGTGLAMLSLDVGTAGLMIAPALGVASGVLLYNVAPGFWDRVSNALVSAGQTVGGKVIAYFDGDKTYLTEETIEIIKNELVNDNFFTESATINEETLQTLPGHEYINSLPIITTNRITLENDTRYDSEPKLIYSYETWIMSDPAIMASCEYNNSKYVVLASKTPFAYEIEFSRTEWNDSKHDYDSSEGIVSHNVVDTPTTYNGETFYVAGVSNSNISPVGNLVNGTYNDTCRIIAYIMLYGSLNTNPNLQPDAKYPTSGEEFPLTYPTWFPYGYPDIDPTGLPAIYPLKYPDIDPIRDPNQEQAQNPEEDPDEIIPILIPDFPIPDPWTEGEGDDDPDEEEDPDEGEEDPDPIPDEPDPPPGEDPVDPNPDPEIPAPIPITPDPTSISSNALFTVYNPSESNLNALGSYLWDSSLMASIRDIWQDPLDGIISLIQVYATPATSSSHNIILGYLDSGVNAPVVSSQFTTIDCGSITIPENKENATDYAPYTSLHLFLPFIGIVELDTNECMNSSINVKYRVDVYTGTCLAQVIITRNKDMRNGAILYVFSGNCSQQIPLTSGNATGVLSALIGGITAGLSVASGGGLGVVAGASIAGNSLTHDMFHVTHSGNISANAGIMGNKKPYLIIGRRHCYDANNYNAFYGFPSNKTVTLKNHSGFVKVKKCFLKTSATKPEHDEIMSLLSDGVIV